MLKSCATGPQAEARSHDSARRQAEAAMAEAAAVAQAAFRQPMRGPNFGRVPRLPGFAHVHDRQDRLGSQQSDGGRTSTSEPGGRAEPQAEPLQADRSAEALVDRLPHQAAASASADGAAAGQAAAESDGIVVLSCSDEEDAAAGGLPSSLLTLLLRGAAPQSAHGLCP